MKRFVGAAVVMFHGMTVTLCSVEFKSDDIDVLLFSKLKTTMCKYDCDVDCKTYQTPLDSCYNGQVLFPKDPSWGEVDIFDKYLEDEASFERSFYSTQDATCQYDPTDSFVLPLDECVGPFGEPRPWGTFTCVDERCTTQ